MRGVNLYIANCHPTGKDNTYKAADMGMFTLMSLLLLRERSPRPEVILHSHTDAVEQISCMFAASIVGTPCGKAVCTEEKETWESNPKLAYELLQAGVQMLSHKNILVVASLPNITDSFSAQLGIEQKYPFTYISAANWENVWAPGNRKVEYSKSLDDILGESRRKEIYIRFQNKKYSPTTVLHPNPHVDNAIRTALELTGHARERGFE